MKLTLLILSCVFLISQINAQEYNHNSIANKDALFEKDEKFKLVGNYYEDIWDITAFSIYGGGKLFSLVTDEGEKEETANLTGSIGAFIETNRMTTNIFFSYNGKKEIEMTDLSVFGSTLINPDRSGNSMSLTHTVALGKKAGGIFKGYIGDQNWILDSTTTLDASPFVLKIGGYLRPYHFEKDGNDADLTIQLMYTHRSIYGDFGNTNNKMIGDYNISRQGYNGFECNLSLRLNKLRIFTAYTVNPQAGIYLPGFSKSQVTFGLNVTGDLVKLK